jgi:5-methylthioadenosine/S-adenosylhomocysteine deaminase
MPTRDAFEERYTAGVLAEDPEPTARPMLERGVLARAMPTSSVALHGCALTSTGARERADVVIDQSTVATITTKKPQGVGKIIETAGIILPGLIDLHGHPEYNVFAPWEPPKLYQDRGQWRGSDEYAALIKAPYSKLTDTATSRRRSHAMPRHAPSSEA